MGEGQSITEQPQSIPAERGVKADPYVLLLAKLIRDVEARERVIVLSERRAA